MTNKTYDHYYKYPYKKFDSYLKRSFKNFGFSIDLFRHLIDFKKNKEQNKISRNIIINKLIELERNDSNLFLNEGLDTLSKLYNYESHNELRLRDYDDSLDESIYRNIFTDRAILLVSNEINLHCARKENKHIYSDLNQLSFIGISIPQINKACSMAGIRYSDPEYKYFINFILFHEMAHDTDYQNYLIYKDYSFGIPITTKTNTIAEQDADILALLMVIKIHKLSYNETLNIISKILRFRSDVTDYKGIDNNIKGLKEDTSYIHLTEPAILILLGLIKRNDIHFIYQLTVQDMIKLSYKITIESNKDEYKIVCIKSLQIPNSDVFISNFSFSPFNRLFNYYFISMNNIEEINNLINCDECDRYMFINEFKNNLIKKLYDDDLLQFNINFRLKISFEYAYLSRNNYQDLIDNEYFQNILDKI